MGHDVLDLVVFFFVPDVFLLRLAHDRAGHGMRKMLLEAGHDLEDLPGIASLCGDDINNLRSGICERAGFVEDKRVGLVEGFQISAALDDDAVGRTLAHGRQNGERCGKLQCAGVVNQQDGSCPAQVAGDEENNAGEGEREGDGHISKAFCFPLDAGFELFGLLDEADNLPDARLVAHAADADDNPAFLYDGAREDGGPFRTLHGKRFTGHGRLVDHGDAVFHDAVHGDCAAVAHDNEVAFGNLAEGHADFSSVVLQLPDIVHIESKALSKAFHGVPPGPVRERIAESKQEREHRDCTEVPHTQGSQNSRRVEDFHAEPAVQEGGKSFHQKRDCGAHTAYHPEEGRQKRPDDEVPDKLHKSVFRRFLHGQIAVFLGASALVHAYQKLKSALPAVLISVEEKN